MLINLYFTTKKYYYIVLFTVILWCYSLGNREFFVTREWLANYKMKRKKYQVSQNLKNSPEQLYRSLLKILKIASQLQTHISTAVQFIKHSLKNNPFYPCLSKSCSILYEEQKAWTQMLLARVWRKAHKHDESLPTNRRSLMRQKTAKRLGQQGWVFHWDDPY